MPPLRRSWGGRSSRVASASSTAGATSASWASSPTRCSPPEEAIGVIPQALMDKELGHGGLTQLHVVESMHERKALMADLSDAFVALPGGFGTYEEFFEVLTWS